MARACKGISSRTDITKNTRQGSDNSTETREAGKLIVVVEQMRSKRIQDNIVRQQNNVSHFFIAYCSLIFFNVN